MIKFSNFIIKNKIWGLFCALWAIVLLAPLVSFPTPSALLGLSWKPELIISILLFLFLTFCLLKNKEKPLSIPGGKSLWIVLPFAAFVLWSGFSALWAESVSSVLHHTLVWAVYLIFFLVFTRIAADRKFFTVSLFSLGAAVGIISTLCIIEFLFSAVINQTFGFRYGRYAELAAVVFPLFFSLLLRLKGTHLVLASFVSISVWLTILFSLSRGAFLAAIAGFAVFFALRLFTKTGFTEKNRLFAAAAALVLMTVFVQFFNQTSSISKFSDAGDNVENSASQNIRLLFYGTAREIIKDNLVTGVGADNFALKFDDYRAVFSAKPENKEIAAQGETAMPERTHNEYLQILTELGIVGGIIFLILVLGILRLSFTDIKQNFSARSNILSHAAFAGLCAFAVSSLFSSFSFRLMQNGLVFFFLLTVLLKNYFKENSDKKTFSFEYLSFQKTAFASVAIVLCLSLAVYSGLKATCQYLVYKAERTEDFTAAQPLYKIAEKLDPSNVAPNYSLALHLMKEEQYQTSAAEFQKAIDKGLYSSIIYSQMATAHILAGNLPDAEKTIARAVEIYPFSVFIRVRYSVILEKLGKNSEAEKHFEIAKNLNLSQAETWRALIADGATAAVEAAKKNPNILPLMSLNPEPAIHAILNERQTINPAEKPQLSFNK